MTKEQTGLLVTGRSLKNFAERHEQPPRDWRMFECVLCKDRVMISPEGARTLDEAKASGEYGPRVGAICTPCTMLLSTTGGIDPSRISRSPEVLEQEKRDPRIKAEIDRVIAGPPMTCDTCQRVEPELVTFPYPAFMVNTIGPHGEPLRIDAHAGNWGACLECARAIWFSELDAMIDRAIAGMAKQGPPPHPRMALMELYLELFRRVDRDAAELRSSRHAAGQRWRP